jgi:hypothetical protein
MIRIRNLPADSFIQSPDPGSDSTSSSKIRSVHNYKLEVYIKGSVVDRYRSNADPDRNPNKELSKSLSTRAN